MLGLFLKYAETPLSELQSAVANRNPELVKNKSHALRGSSGNIGLTDLFQAFTKLEEIDENDWITAEQILNEILEKFIELKTKVSHLFELEIENES
jgi:HPt (histidine-containing phosphotransfer) domain-containing protein